MTRDGRQHDRKTKAAMRILAVQRTRDGEPVKAVMESLGLCRTTFYKWCPRISLLPSPLPCAQAEVDPESCRQSKSSRSFSGSTERTRFSTALILACGRGKSFAN